MQVSNHCLILLFFSALFSVFVNLHVIHAYMMWTSAAARLIFIRLLVAISITFLILSLSPARLRLSRAASFPCRCLCAFGCVCATFMRTSISMIIFFLLALNKIHRVSIYQSICALNIWDVHVNNHYSSLFVLLSVFLLLQPMYTYIYLWVPFPACAQRFCVTSFAHLLTYSYARFTFHMIFCHFCLSCSLH